MKKLPKRFKEKWLKALRSGEYKQGNGSLYNDGKYCCLGVAYCITHKSKPPRDTNWLNKRMSFLPDALKGGELLPLKLAKMNDDKNRSFKQIANWIEKNL